MYVYITCFTRHNIIKETTTTTNICLIIYFACYYMQLFFVLPVVIVKPCNRISICCSESNITFCWNVFFIVYLNYRNPVRPISIIAYNNQFSIEMSLFQEIPQDPVLEPFSFTTCDAQAIYFHSLTYPNWNDYSLVVTCTWA